MDESEKLSLQQQLAKAHALAGAQEREIKVLKTELEIYKQELNIAQAEIHRLSKD